MTLAIRLEPEIEHILNELARTTGRSKSYYVREALMRHLEEIKDVYTALQRLETPSRLYSTREVMDALKLESGVGRKSPQRTKKTGKRSTKTHP